MHKAWPRYLEFCNPSLAMTVCTQGERERAMKDVHSNLISEPCIEVRHNGFLSLVFDHVITLCPAPVWYPTK